MKQERNSSIELFRILATFLVLVIHWNGWFVGGIPENISWNNLYGQMGGQILIRGFSVCCVNCFLLLSGYFSIKLKWKSLVNLYVVLFGIFIPFYIADSVRIDSFSFKELFKWAECFSRSGYFIQDYALLMFFSPVLNAFVDKKGKDILWWVLTFLGVEFWFECIQHVETIGFNQGYSFIHFVLMYMIGRCVHLYLSKLQKINKICWILGYMACVIGISGMYILGIGRSWGYCNPLVVLSTVCLFMPFTFYTFHNKFVNSMAKSTLAVYIMQCFDPAKGVLVMLDNKLLSSLPYSQYLLSSVFVLTCFFLLCIVYDKVRGWVTNPLLQYLYKKVKIC